MLAAVIGGERGIAATGGASYAYDALGRIVTVIYDNGTTITYTYDAAGNRTSQTVTPNGATLPPPPSSPPSSGAVPMTKVNITTGGNNFNLWNYLLANGLATAGKSGGWQVTIASGVTFGSSSTSTPAFDTGVFPPGSVLALVNNGLIQGAGGAGGNGDSMTTTQIYNQVPSSDPTGSCNPAFGVAGTAGSPGGPAFRSQIAVLVTNGGGIWGGGGGGGGGGGAIGRITFPGIDISEETGGGGGGGAGSNAGAGGLGGNSNLGASLQNVNGLYEFLPGLGGSSGTSSSGGAGGHGGIKSPQVFADFVTFQVDTSGGAGGGPGQPGAVGIFNNTQPPVFVSCGIVFPAPPGGVAGPAVLGNGNVTWVNKGDVRGSLQ